LENQFNFALGNPNPRSRILAFRIGRLIGGCDLAIVSILIRKRKA